MVKRWSIYGMGMMRHGKEEALINGQSVYLAADYDAVATRIRELEAHIEKWVFVTALQTFEDRERFRTESEKLLYSQSDAKVNASLD